ncbi:hypothetical protein CEE44_01320 [Candidatus Woesearchaeota archaeon B3_Woes]|nr:MAG: hypothetical protein CEE44_01320 [Candidatus Woesearchaeota archaeon B3_Woes]
MNIEKLRIIKSDERGFMYDCDKLNFISRKKGTTNADHSHNVPEILYLVKGEAELTIGDETKTVEAPVKIEIPEKTHHKLVALSDIEILEDRKSE